MRSHSFSRSPGLLLALRAALAMSLAVVGSTVLQAGNLGRTGMAPAGSRGGSASGAASTSQTSTAATSATAQASQTAAMTQTAQASMQRSVQALQILNAQQNAQSAARNLIISGSNPAANAIPDGLMSGGLLPLQAPTAASSAATSVNPDGSSSVILGAHTAITLPPGSTGSDQISVSGTGTVGSVTTGGTITPLTAGTATTVAPGSTISLNQAGTITFASGSTTIPSTFSTYSFGLSAVPTSWTGISGLTQTAYGSGVAQNIAVDLTQSQQQAVLTWQSFNIGKNTTLDFDQSAGGSDMANWVAINKIAAGIAPSQIFGAIQGPGQVYVINQNGILFGGSSRVNLGALVASSLPINDNLVQNGLLNNPDYQFLFSQIDIPAGTQGPTPAFQPEENHPAPGANGSSGGVVAHVDPQGNVSLVPATGLDGDVAVEAGAQLSSPATSQNVGGRVALVGPNVTNAGTIATPDGQTILAAGMQVAFEAHDANDPSLRGLDIYVGAATDPSVASPAYSTGTASNFGLIGTLNSGVAAAVPGAAVTLTGSSVDQLGSIDLSTSVNLNSRVDLLADFDTTAFFKGSGGFSGTTGFYPTATGAVSLGENSLTDLQPDLSSTDTIVGTELALPSLVNIQGESIGMESGALLLAPSASLPSNTGQAALGIAGLVLPAGVTLDAGQWSAANGSEFFSNSTGQVTLNPNAIIDVAGSENVSASVAEDVVAVQLLGSELANASLQQSGALRGQTVYVDLRDVGIYDGTPYIGTPLADASGYVNLVQRSIGELTDAGGTVAINAGDSVTLDPGSTVDVSGGWINYQGATVSTTNVISNGALINISLATPNLVYSGIYSGFTQSDSKYGLTQSYSSPFLNGTQYDPGFIQGGNGGSLTVAGPSLTIDGTLTGNTVAGAYQRTAASTYDSAASAYAGSSVLPTINATLTVPKSSSLSLSIVANTTAGLEEDPVTPQNVVIGSGGSADDLILPSNLTAANGFGAVSIEDPTGNVTVSPGAALVLPDGGSLKITGANIDIESDIAAPGGSIDFTAEEISPFADAPFPATPLVPATAVSPTGAVSGTGNFTLGAGVTLETGGLLVNDSTQIGNVTPKLTNGGSVAIDGFSVFLRANSQVDASGGAYIGSNGAITYGSGGAITIQAGQDPTYPYITGGQIFLGSQLSAYSGLVGHGGTLTLQAPLIQIGGQLQQGLANGDLDANVVAERGAVYGNGNTLWLDPAGTGAADFFSQGGFESFTVRGIGEPEVNSSGVPQIDPVTDNPLFDPAVLVAANTTIQPVVDGYLYSSGAALTPMTAGQEAQLLPSERSPVNLAFDALGVTFAAQSPPTLVRGDIVVGANSVIQTDPQDITSSSGVAFDAPAGTVTLLGRVIVPGGTISVTGASDSTTILFADSSDALPTVELGDESLLSTSGVVEYSFNNQGYTTGSVLDGGTISVKGNIVAEAGSILDVSGANATLEVSSAQNGISPYGLYASAGEIATLETSNAGTINLTGGQELFTEATLLGHAGGAAARGGTLTLSSGGLGVTEPTDATLVVTQQGTTFAPSANGDYIGTVVDPSHPVLDPASTSPLQINAYFAADTNIFASTPVAGDTGNAGLAGGFQTLNLKGTVLFSGPVTITTGSTITAGASGVLYADGAVSLNAPDVTLGLPFALPATPVLSQESIIFNVPVNPSTGSGILNVDASQLAEVGNLTLEDIGSVNFNTTPANQAVALSAGVPVPLTGAGTLVSTTPGTLTSAGGTVTAIQPNVAIAVTSGSTLTLSQAGSITASVAGIIPARTAGDVEGDGTFDVEGTLAVTAAQVYVPTESFFSIFDYDYNGVTGNSSVIFTRPLQDDTLPALPLSAGGTINVYASTIMQDGVLRAPSGSINLGIGIASAAPVDYFTGNGVAGGVVSGAPVVPTTVNITLGAGGITSVSLIDPNTGEGITVPYGLINNSGDWIDPAGNDITAAANGLLGLPAKAINISAQTVVTDAGATLDLRGGGDLFAYQFVSGTGGTNDILSSSYAPGSFAVIPTYSTAYAPYAPYALSSSLETNGVADAGYANSNIPVGEQIYLNASNGLPAGTYTVLPARDALVPGAYLVTPASTEIMTGAEAQPSGITYVSGYEFSGLSNSTAAAPLSSEFEVESQATVLTQADYQISSANTYFPQNAMTNGNAVPRLPMDAGQLVVVAGSLSLPSSMGTLLENPATGGLGGEVDIASSGAINIDNAADAGTVDPTPGVLNLDSAELTDFGAASLLIGGYRTTGESKTSLATVGSSLLLPSSGGTITFPSGTPGNDAITVSGNGVVGAYTAPGGAAISITGGQSFTLPTGSVVSLTEGGAVTFSGGAGGPIPVTLAVNGTGVSVTTSQMSVNNAGAPLAGSDIILVSNGTLSVGAGSTVAATASGAFSAGALSLAGGGTLVRVSSDSSASINRIGVQASSSDPADLEIGVPVPGGTANTVTTISGGAAGSIILDSTNQTSIGSTNVALSGSSASLDSGQIVIELTTPATALSTTGLILSGDALANLQADANSLSLLSYTSIDFYNGDLTDPGIVGGAENGGTFPISSLALHATDIRGTGGGDVIINAQNVTLDNSSNGTALGAVAGSTPAGTLTVNAQTISLGMNTLQVEQFGTLDLNAANQVDLTGLGTLGLTDGTPAASGLAVSGNLNIDTPLLTGRTIETGANPGFTSYVDAQIVAQGTLVLADSSSTSPIAGSAGLGTEIGLTGSSVTEDTNVVAHSGSVSVTADGTGAGSDVVVGTDGAIDVSGVEQTFVDLAKFTNGGAVNLTSDSGNIAIAGSVNVGAASGTGSSDSVAGSAGSLNLRAVNGTFTAGGTINGQAGVVSDASGAMLSSGTGGSFSLDVGSLALGNLDAIESLINPSASGPVAGDDYVGGFTAEQNIRLRNGSLSVDGVIAATTVNLATDNGAITVTGTGRIDATAAGGGLIDTTTLTQMQNGLPVTTLKKPGATGGSITLAAGVTSAGAIDPQTGTALGSVVLESGSLLTVAGQGFDDAGRGGAVTLQAGSDINGTTPSTGSGRSAGGTFGSGVAVDEVESGSTIDLSIQYQPVQLNTSGSSQLTLSSPGSIYFPNGTPGNDEISVSGSGIVGTLVSSSGASTPLAGGTPFSLSSGSTLELAAGAAIDFVGGGTGGSITLDLPSNADFTAVGATNAAGNAALTATAQGDLSGTLVLQAPQTSDNLDVQVDPIDGTVLQASSVVVAGLHVQNANSSTTASLDGSSSPGDVPSDTNFETQAIANANTFDPSGGSAAYQTMSSALIGAHSQGVSGVLEIEPAEEIDNTAGGLVLNNTWDFSQNRFGPGGGLPGLLTLRAAGDLSVAFGASLSDGFDVADANYTYTAALMSGQSWSFDLVAGADFTSASVAQATSGAGSFVLGQDAPLLPTSKATTAASILANFGYYQTIRTGTGTITIDAGSDVQIDNEVASIYTAGSAVPNITGFDQPYLPNTVAEGDANAAQYSDEGGDVTISALGSIGHYTASGGPDSSKEMPTDWLYRQGATSGGLFTSNPSAPSGVESTSWWVDFSNFFEGVGALGGGNVSLNAGGSVVNLDAVAPTNAQTPVTDGNGNVLAPSAANLVELGGGDVTVQAGVNIDAGVYYVERGQGTLAAGNEILTNSTRTALNTSGIASAASNPDPYSWLPTTLLAGDADFSVSANGSVLLGPVANPFLLPQNIGNGVTNGSYFSTYSTADTVDVSSVSGATQIQDAADNSTSIPGNGSLYAWYANLYSTSGGVTDAATSQPWLQLVVGSISPTYSSAFGLMPPTLRATAFTGDVDLVGSLLLSPSPTGTIDLTANESVNGFQPNTESNSVVDWGSSYINLSDANPASIPGVASPISFTKATQTGIFTAFDALFSETGATQGLSPQQQANLHADINGNVLHADDPDPVHIYAQTGSISGLTLFSGKFSDLVAGNDIQDIALYIQNASAGQITVVDAGQNLTAYDPNSTLRTEAQATGNIFIGQSAGLPLGQNSGAPNTGDIQISGPGTLEVLAGGSITLGDGPSNTSGPNGTSNGTDTGITSIGDARNPTFSPDEPGASIVVGAGLGGATAGLGGVDSTTQVNFTAFEDEFLNPNSTASDPGNVESDRYLPDLVTLIDLPASDSLQQIWSAFNGLPLGQRNAVALQLYYTVLRDAGRDHNNSTIAGASTYQAAKDAIADLFPQPHPGNITLSSREIATVYGGNVDLFAPDGGVTVGFNLTSQPADQGILTEGGGDIDVYTSGDVDIGTSRIFTLDGGNIVIYSSNGNIAAGSASKTVQSAPPTRVLVDTESGAVETDLAGLATGGGIGVLESQSGAQVGDVDLIAPNGTVDAGDAGIRVSGNLNIAAVQILNAGNISVGGKSAGVPTTSTPNIAGIAAASGAAGAGAQAANSLANQQAQNAQDLSQTDAPSIITVEVLGYGGD